MMIRRICVVLVLVIAARSAWADEEVRLIPSRSGVTEAVLLIRPQTPPLASVILFPGGDGSIGLKPDWPEGKRSGNFLVRSADLFARAGFLVAVVDAPSDSSTLWNLRTTERHAKDVAAVIAHLRAEAPVPVWLIGTSMGTLSAANAAARLLEGGPDGIVLTSSVTELSLKSTESVLTVDLERIRVPVLVVNHRNDVCKLSPPKTAERIVREVENSPRRDILSFSGGKPAGMDECGPFAPHGYYGIEAEVVGAIAGWISPAESPGRQAPPGR